MRWSKLLLNNPKLSQVVVGLSLMISALSLLDELLLLGYKWG